MRKPTNYRLRLKLLRSGLPRLVIRKSDSQVIAQIVTTDKSTIDKTIVGANGIELQKLGWPLSRKNIPAAYLIGFLLAKKAKDKVKSDIIVDKGLRPIKKDSFMFAVIKGAIDGGLKVRAGEINISEDRIKGKHIINIAQKTKDKNMFSKTKDKVENIENLIEDIKNKITSKYG